MPSPPEAFEPSMLRLDDPDHKRLRGLVSQAFNQRSVDASRPRIRAIAGELRRNAVSGALRGSTESNRFDTTAFTSSNRVRNSRSSSVSR
jgi:cytochrome P450